MSEIQGYSETTSNTVKRTLKANGRAMGRAVIGKKEGECGAGPYMRQVALDGEWQRALVLFSKVA